MMATGTPEETEETESKEWSLPPRLEELLLQWLATRRGTRVSEVRADAELESYLNRHKKRKGPTT